MNSSLSKNILLVGRIILPAIMCAFIVQFCLTNHIGDYYFWTFPLIIIFFNIEKTKYNITLSCLLSTILSILVYFLSIIIYGVIFSLIDFLFISRSNSYNFIFGIDINTLRFLIPIAIISPLLMFYCYGILFKIQKSRFDNFVKLGTIILLIAYTILLMIFKNKENYLYVGWQFIMALALQLILYQNELKALFKPKNE